MGYRLEWEPRGVKLTVVDSFDNDMLFFSAAAIREERFSGLEYGIVDFLQVNTFPVDTGTIRRLATGDARAYRINPGLKLAIVADQQVMSGLFNMYRTYFELANEGRTWDMKLFASEREARLWLDGLLAGG